MIIDSYLYLAIAQAAASTELGGAAAVLAASVLIWLLVVWYLLFILLRPPKNLSRLLAAVLGGSMVYLFNTLLTFWWFRPRPFLSLEVAPLINVSAATKSFPSDHAALAFFIAWLLSQARPQGRWAYLLAALIALGRVAVGVHYPGDVLAGAAIGLIFGYLTVQVEKLFLPKKA